MKDEDRAPDFSYWAKLSFWTIAQSTALLIGEDPDTVLEGDAPAPNCPDDVKAAFFQMFRLLDSHIRLSGVGANQPPTEIIEWALHARVDPPSALVEAARAQGRTLIEKHAKETRDRDDAATGDAEKPLGERERSTLLRIIIGMAIGGYGYNPDDKRSDAATTISSDLERFGLDGSAQTIRNKLHEARELLPGDWSERRTGNAN